jgi:RHS repeat-associated protein
LNFRVAHLSRCVTDGAFEFGSSSELNVTYDSSNNLLSESIPLDATHTATTSYTYTSFGEVLTVTDPLGHTTTNVYDTHGNLTSVTSPAPNGSTAFDNMTSKTDRKNQTINYVYDGLNRLTKKQYPNSTEVDYIYDLVGKIQQVNDPTGTYASAYDNMGRLIGTTTSYSFLTSRSFSNAYTYDAASNRTGFTDPENGSTTYSYDTLNRLTTLAPPSAFTTGSFGFSYDALSRRTQMTRPNSVTTNYTYDNLSRLLTVLHQLSGSTIDGASYTVDSAGNRTAKTDQRAAVTSNFTHDAIYQLTQVMQGPTTTESYSYDPVGNRTASLGVSSYTTNASNELTAIPGVTYTYDSNGNTLAKTDSTGTTSYTWDFENRLTSVTLPGSGGTVTFKYDPLGRRIYKSSSAGTSVYAYGDYDLVEETNSSGTAVARYAQGARVDEPLAMLRSSTTSYYDADGLGSVTSLANGSGPLTQTYTYDSFGKVTTSLGSLVNSLQYTGREFDSETGLYYYRARYYDSAAGRFISEDPISFNGDIDFYAYVGNSPTNLTDPSGLCPPEGCAPPNPHNPKPRSTCSIYPDFAHWAACETLAGDDTVGQCVRGCLQDQFDTSKGKYKCNETDLHCACFDACGFTGVRARGARINFACDYHPAPFKWPAGMR